MAAAVSMQPPMDRPSSFDQPRSRSTPPFIHRTSYDRSPSPSIHHQQPPYHHRTSSNASTSSPSPSPYNQPFPTHNYFPQVAQHQLQTAWAATAIPVNSFYPSPMQLHPGQSFHQGFQQSQADFAAWATAYHQMVAASAAMGNGGGSGTQYEGYSAQAEYLNEGSRRRTSSGPSTSKPFSHANPEAGYSSYHHSNVSASSTQHASHPYKRALANRPSRENVAPTPIVVGMSRSVSQPALSPTESRHSATSPVSTPTQETHRRTMSFESDNQTPAIVPPRAASRQDSFNSERERSGRSTPTPTATAPAAPRSASPAPLSRPAPVSERPKTPQPLHTGPIANATNTPSTRPSPLSQSTASDLDKPKSGGLKNRLRKVLDKDASTPKKQSTAPSVVRSFKPTFASPSETSTRSATPPVTPPQANDFSPPSAPFAVSHPGSMGSDLSLAETERTATAPSEINAPTGKTKRSLFRMKNMSTDNISLSSTVSSASMMIRKMGSIGKLARRNSLMGISKIFKDKPKDEDAALPEKDAKKKSKKQSKKDKAKAEASPAVVSHATAEPERISEDEDRTLAGLSPAAKLARQHTLRSKAEQAKQAREDQAKTGEPAWDNNTTTRNHQNGILPSISSVTGPPEVVRVTPGRTSTTVRAVQVSEHEYDSEDDSSDGETIEDVTVQLAKSRLSDASIADREFREAWGNAWIDREAVPKKGILKVTVSSENLEKKAARQRSNSSAQITPTQPHSGPSPISIDHADARQIDGLTHPTPIPQHLQNGKEVDPLAAALESLDSSGPSVELNFPYSTPAHNTSAPVLSLVAPGKPMAMRSMTAPARKRLVWAPECAVYSTYDPNTYDRRSEPATCNRLTPELAQMIKEELNAFKMEMPVHPDSRNHTHFFVS